MATRVGINGFGRIGRQVLKAMNDQHPNELEVVVVNDLTSTETNAHLFKYDSNYGRYPGKVEATEDSIIIDGKKVKVIAERDPSKIPWRDFGVDIVVGVYGPVHGGAQSRRASREGGAKKVLITAPAKEEDITIVLGVNEGRVRPGEASHNLQRLLYHQLHCSGC